MTCELGPLGPEKFTRQSRLDNVYPSCGTDHGRVAPRRPRPSVTGRHEPGHHLRLEPDLPNPIHVMPAQPTLWNVFWNTVALSIVPFSLAMGYLFLWPVEVRPAEWSAGFNPDRSGPYVSNDELTRAHLLPVHWVEEARRESQRYLGMGPETLAMGPDGKLYTGLCDGERDASGEAPPRCKGGVGAQGWVVRVDPSTHRVERYVQTGGRPLGLAFDERGRLYIADATQGLLRVDASPTSERGAAEAHESDWVAPAATPYARRVASCRVPADERQPSRDMARPEREHVVVEGANPFERVPGPQQNYNDSVAVTRDPVSGKEEVWFTCPSQRWPLEEIHRDGLESVPTGRVLRYEPCDSPDPLQCTTTLAADRLMFANGIAISDRADAVWVSEWYGYRILTLTPPATGERGGPWVKRSFVDNLPGYPDNLTLDADGTLWVGLVILRLPVVDRFHPHPHLKKILARLPGSAVVSRHAFAIGLDRAGRVVHNLQDATGFFDQVTGVYPVGSALYFTSNTAQALACLPRPGAELSIDPCVAWAGPPRL